MKLLVLPLDRGSISFCHYENLGTLESPEPIPDSTLESTLAFAKARGLGLNLVYGRAEPPPAQRELIEGVPHAALVPLAMAEAYPLAIVVISPAEAEETAARLAGERRSIIILRAGRADLSRLSAAVTALFGVARRVNLCVFDLERITQDELDVYGAQLEILAGELADRYHKGENFELNALSDRILLGSMRNCDAGLEHFTVGFDGRLYLCPAFMHDDPDACVGDLGSGPAVANAALLGLDRAPLCSGCDSWQCRRCVYLSKKLTLEVNIPSRQQCVASHLERAASARLLSLVRDIQPFAAARMIPALDYLDPFDARDRRREGPQPGAPPKGASIGGSIDTDGKIENLLTRILATQEEILTLLRAQKEGDPT